MKKNHNKFFRFITCPCGNTEDLPIDAPRHHSQHFAWIKNTNSEALYRCTVCSRTVTSYIPKNPVAALSSFAASFTGEEPMDGDQTEQLSRIFLYFLNQENGNLSKEEDIRIRTSLNITD